jgi:putative ABC transport system permease protein
VGEGARVTALGLVLGMIGAWALTRVLKTLVFGVSTTDLPTFALAAGAVALAALAGAYAPARRASRVDPKAALTSE